MKKLLFVAFIFTLLSAGGKAQSVFSEQNLKQANQEELELYLFQAKKQKRAGGILLIAAPVSLGTGLLLWSNSWKDGSESQLGLGSFMLIGSLGAAIVGIPLRITGSSRVKRVSEEWNSINHNASFSLEPCLINSFPEYRSEPGLSLKITF